MITIRSPRFSFVQLFESLYGFEPESYDSCLFDVGFCLPVYAFDDIAFQFSVVTETVEEADELCAGGVNKVEIGLVRECGDSFDVAFAERPDMVRVGEKEVLYKWPHGFPGFDTEYDFGECFKVKVIVHMDSGDISACSNCFERIREDCFTSVLEYGATQNIFGFNYCDSGTADQDETEPEVCEDPTIIQFEDALTLSIPYTVAMKNKYGDVPTVEIWTLDAGQYVKTFIRAGFDAYPPTMIIADLGGPATGFVKIS
jgi:hypothetical protein